MTVVKSDKTVQEYLFTDVPGVSDPFRLIIDEIDCRVTIYHYDGVVSSRWNNHGDSSFKSFLVGLSGEHVQNRFAYERSSVRTQFYFHETIQELLKKYENFGTRIIKGKAVGGENKEFVQALLGMDETDCMICFHDRLSELDPDQELIHDPWQKVDFKYDIPPFIRHICKHVWPEIVKTLKDELKNEQSLNREISKKY